MELRRGIPLAVAPRFQSRLPWIDRVQINGGVEAEGGRVSPRRDWRRPGDAELALLLADGEAATSCAHAGLINLPEHLRQEWWSLAEETDGQAVDARRYRAFVDGVLEFLRFKRLPLPARCRVDVVVSRPGQRSTRWGAASGYAGALGDGPERAAGGPALEPLVGLVNLGDEPTHLVLLNLAPPAMAAMVGLAWPSDPALPASADLAGRFFAALPTYPLIRVRLEAGDGLWLPAHGAVHDVCTLDKREVDVALTIRAEAGGED